SGKSAFGPLFAEGRLEKEFHHKSGRKHFVLVRLSKRGLSYSVSPLASHGSADILALSKADGFMVVDSNVRTLKAKAKVRLITWKVLR
ncbi:hypothetical protein ACFL2I_03915, partial [Candidatus Omnitrophota bacterium]